MNFTLKEEEYDLVVAGEILIDMISSDYVNSLEDASGFKKYFGGSPANIASNIARQGFNAKIISCVGEDGFGKFLKNKLKESKVDTSFIQTNDKKGTTVVCVTKSKGTPEFIAYRSADKEIVINERELDLIKSSKIFHVSAFAFSQNPAREELFKAVKYAKSIGKLVCVDPNYREILWDKNIDGVSFMKEIISYADVIKPSEDDAFHILGEMNIEEYCKEFYKMGAKLIIMTLGKDGLIYYDGKEFVRKKTLAEEVIDTTGAGDAFWSGFYCGILKGYDIEKAVNLGSCFSAQKLKKIGAVVDLPTMEEIEEIYNIE